MSEELARQFETFRPQLRSFILRMTASAEDADDLTQATFVRATEKFDSFRNESSIKTWVFAIATNLARNHRRTMRRWPENATDLGKQAALATPGFMARMMETHASVPGGAFEMREHISMCFLCVTKTLPIDEQVPLWLVEIYEFTVNEVAQILDVTGGVVKHLLLAGRGTMKDIFDHRCSLIGKHGVCHQCTELNGAFNPKHEAQKELVKIEMTRDAANKSRDELFDLRANLVRDIDPFLSRGAKLTLLHLANTREAVDSSEQERDHSRPGGGPAGAEPTGRE